MSSFGLLCRQCLRVGAPHQSPVLQQAREFSASQAVFFKRAKKLPTVSKKAQAAKAKRKALKNIRKDPYEQEKMPLTEAIYVLRSVEVAKTAATCELVIKTEMRQGGTIPKGRITLPREAKPKPKDVILAFAEGREAEEAKKAGIDIVGGPELIDGVAEGRIQATIVLSTPALLRPVAQRLGRILGPKGLMPSERRGTVTEDFEGFVQKLEGTAEWKGDQMGTIRLPIAKLDWPVEDVITNFRQFLYSVKRATGNERDPTEKIKPGQKPSSSITRVLLSSEQGPSIRIADY